MFPISVVALLITFSMECFNVLAKSYEIGFLLLMLTFEKMLREMNCVINVYLYENGQRLRESPLPTTCEMIELVEVVSG